MLTFQEMILRLQNFWVEKGCALGQGHDVEAGAGTFNPATFLRALGPEPYNTVYVEPSRRPQDGRYGENPNRTQLFHQMQVVLKPSPANIQELYLQSLEVIGFDRSRIDVRFVHDDWESPTIGAWGLGWEVWIDGMEVTQFTYFQQVAGFSMDPIPVEITYGLERICMLAQGVDNFFDMRYSKELTYGDVYHENEVEWSQYNFTQSNPQMWKSHFNDFEKEAHNLTQKKLPIPAYDFVMKASHAFNMLEARGVISVTERTGYIHRVRDLSFAAAKCYLEKREAMHFPLATEMHKEKFAPSQFTPGKYNPEGKRDFLIEIGSEELPATFVPIGMREIKRVITTLLKEEKLSYGEIKVFGTPRRLSVIVHELQEGKSATSKERRGPSVNTAFDEAGAPTKQGAGFLKSIGLEGCKKSEALAQENLTEKDGYLIATLSEPGRATSEILFEKLPKAISSMQFPKKMRWGSSDLAFARPIHWLIALFGTETVPFTLAHLIAGQKTYGHRQLAPKEIVIKSPDEYLSKLRRQKVLADVNEREKSIEEQLSQISGSIVAKDRVMREVLHLSEFPQIAEATYDESFLRAPDSVQICEMVNHQRYFPIANEKGNLQNRFVIVADNKVNDQIIKNNQAVLSARLSDGLFLYETDLQTAEKEWSERLKNVTFQEKLGSLHDKVKRLRQIVEKLPMGEKEKTVQAATLCKNDLVSELVGEFPELQGVIGRHYAEKQGVDAEVAQAIEEHYLPKTENGTLPQSPTGTALSLADKMDNLLGYFSVGLKPTSSSDPYAMRRQAIGILKILITHKISCNLPDLLLDASNAFPQLKGHPHNQKELIDQILSFMLPRAKSVYEELGYKGDEIEAALQGKLTDPYDQFCKIKALHEFRSGEDFGKLFEVFKRAKGQLENKPQYTLNESLFEKPQEKELAKQLSQIANNWPKERDYAGAFSLLATLKTPLADLFDNVKILADDPKTQENRLALLQRVFARFEELLDFRKIQE
ncbi:MAG: glycine--tRNA ligase subunit beta [Candidatus Algichlamydia australiensis]|nr:glycine--tRNA ligase subunit beta [Chlamydiales bacterium]